MNEDLVGIIVLSFVFGCVICTQASDGLKRLGDSIVESKIDSFVSWYKKKWYTRLLSIFLVPILVVIVGLATVLVVVPLCVLADFLFVFPGKLIYWIAKGKFPERNSLFQPWEKKDE